MTEEEVWQCFTTLLSLDEKEEEEKQGVESEQDPQHAGATSGGVLKNKYIYIDIKMLE